MTTLYNINTEQFKGNYPNGYRIDGKPAQLTGDWVELTIVNPAPDYDQATERIKSTSKQVDLEAKTLTTVYEYEAIPAFELQRIAMNWEHIELAKRIKAPAALVNDYPEIAVWMMLNKLPIEIEEEDGVMWAYLYMNIVRPEHQQLVTGLNLTIEDIPI